MLKKVALAVCPENPVPPKGYGGAERIADTMCQALSEGGVEVDLFCGEGSTCKHASSLYTYPNIMSQEASMAEFLIDLYKKDKFPYDCVIDYTANHLLAQYLPKTWALMGGDPFKKYPHDNVRNRVYLSREFAEFNGFGKNPVLSHPLLKHPDKYKVFTEPDDHFVYIGAIHPMKGIDIAINACIESEQHLYVYGPVRDKHYFDKIVGFFDNPFVDYCGILEDEGRDEAFGNAKAFFHLTRVCDADPIAPIEAMVRGTPVIGFPYGGICSTIIQKKTGSFSKKSEKYYETNGSQAYNSVVEAVIFQMNQVHTLDRNVVASTIRECRDYSAYKDMLFKICSTVCVGGCW